MRGSSRIFATAEARRAQRWIKLRGGSQGIKPLRHLSDLRRKTPQPRLALTWPENQETFDPRHPMVQDERAREAMLSRPFRKDAEGWNTKGLADQAAFAFRSSRALLSGSSLLPGGVSSSSSPMFWPITTLGVTASS